THCNLTSFPTRRSSDLLEVEGKQNKVWKYERGMEQYFEFMLQGRELVAPLFTGERFFDEKSTKEITDIEPGEGASWAIGWVADRSEEHTSELQSLRHLV